MKLIKIFKIIFLGLTVLLSTLMGESIARVMKANGEVLLKQLGKTTYDLQVKPGQAISNGDAIRVGDSGFAVVIFLDDRSVVKIREKTDFQFVETDNTRSLNMERGTILNDVKKEGRTKTFRVETPVSVASVKGTEFAAIVDPSGMDKFIGKTGTFDVFNTISGQTVSVGPGQKAISNALGNLMQAPAEPGDYPQDPEVEAGEQPTEEEAAEEEPAEEQPEEVEPEKVEEEVQPEPEPEPQPKEIMEEAPEAPEAPEAEQPQEKPEPKGKKPFNMGLGIGSATIDGQIYNQLALRPELKFGKLGIGLDLVLYIDNEGNIRKNEWDEASDFVDKFLYIRWGEKSDPFWFQWGSLPSVTLGYGGLLAGYSNMMEFPSIRRVGVNAGLNFGKYGTELFLANVKDFKRGGTLMGLRGTYKVSKRLPLTIGTNFIMDINQFSGLKDTDTDNYPDVFDDFPDNKHLWNDTDGDGIPDYNGGDKEPATGWDIDGDGDNELSSDAGGSDVENLKGIPFSLKDNKATVQGFTLDLGYPILRKKSLSLDVYTEYNKLIFPAVSGNDIYSREKMDGTGITIPGIRASLFKFLNVSFEYRIKQGYFVPQFFDQSYDLNRVVADYVGGVAQVRTKDQMIFQDPNSNIDTKGMFGSASANLFNLASFAASYTNMKADNGIEFNSFSANVSINAEKIPKLSIAEAYYLRNNDKNPFDFGNPSVNTILGYRLGYEVSAGVSLIWDFRQFYRDVGTGLEPVKQTTIETAFNF